VKALNEEHHSCERAAASAVEHAIKAGELLIYAKAEVKHGEWEPWLKENFEGSLRTAQMYMRVFRNRDKLTKAKRVSDLSLRGALKELSEPSAPGPPKIRIKVPTLNIKDDPPREFLVSPAIQEEVAHFGQYASSEVDEDTAAVVDVYYGKPEDREEDLLTGWTDEERSLLERLQAGETIVINMHQDGHPKLKAWAEKAEVFVRIDRRSDWGNPFEEGKDGDRETVIYNFEHHYLPYKLSLYARRSELQGGKALGCWCAPARCHGHVLKGWAEKA
jgi:hypothetical protein